MKKLGTKSFIISAPFATRQCGHLSQVDLIDTYHDPLYARAIYLEDGDTKIIHLSLDLLAFDDDHRKELNTYLDTYYKGVKLITSATHTHYGNDVKDERYQAYLMDLLKRELVDIDIREYQTLSYRYKTVHFDEVGKSRISGYETHNEYLTVVTILSDKPLVTFIVHNVHPTILQANVPYFSSEFPGYVLSKLKEKYSDIFFTYMSGAMGDISSRFTRSGQDYESLKELGDKLFDKVDSLLDDGDLIDLTLSYKEVYIPYKHNYDPIDETKIRKDLTDRELETIKYGKIMRANIDPSTSNKGADMGILDLGEFKFIFYPNEIFSEFIDDIDINNSILVSYSNGYGPYILPINFPYVTYEMFIDTLDDDTKMYIHEVLRETK